MMACVLAFLAWIVLSVALGLLFPNDKVGVR